MEMHRPAEFSGSWKPLDLPGDVAAAAPGSRVTWDGVSSSHIDSPWDHEAIKSRRAIKSFKGLSCSELCSTVNSRRPLGPIGGPAPLLSYRRMNLPQGNERMVQSHPCKNTGLSGLPWRPVYTLHLSRYLTMETCNYHRPTPTGSIVYTMLN